MTIDAQLRALCRQFPRSEELAVSREMVEDYETALVQHQRFCALETPTVSHWPMERVGTLAVRRLPLAYRDRRLALVGAGA